MADKIIGIGETAPRKKEKGFVGETVEQVLPRVAAAGVGVAAGRQRLAGNEGNATRIQWGAALLGFLANLVLKDGTAKQVAGGVETAGIVLVAEHELAPLSTLVRPVAKPQTSEERDRAADTTDATTATETQTQEEAVTVAVQSAKQAA